MDRAYRPNWPISCSRPLSPDGSRAWVWDSASPAISRAISGGSSNCRTRCSAARPSPLHCGDRPMLEQRPFDVLFVDDDAQLREANTESLELEGIRTHPLPDAEAVLTRI